MPYHIKVKLLLVAHLLMGVVITAAGYHVLIRSLDFWAFGLWGRCTSGMVGVIGLFVCAYMVKSSYSALIAKIDRGQK